MDVDSDDEQKFEVGDESETENENAAQNLIAGKIVKIHLKNFLTHTEATVYPSEQLNLVIGPNGTGKSSIVASIIIGMGGSTKILSERNKLCDYVKNGKDIAQVTVTVYKDERRNRKSFCREFNRKNKSTYTVDGHTITEKEYLTQISELNVQVGNLCQFLPQERVQDFAKQNPQELFASTQKSICTDEMMGTFVKLKELRDSQLHGNKEIEKMTNLLRDNERKVELLEAAVENIRRQDELVRRKNVIEKKLAWMDFEEVYTKCKEVDKDLSSAQAKHDEWVKKKNELQKLAKDKAQQRQKYEKSLATEATKKKKFCNNLDSINDEIHTLSTEFRNAKEDLDAYIQDANERNNKINDCQMVLNTCRQECDTNLETIGSIDRIKRQIAGIDETVNKTRGKIRELSDLRGKFNFKIENVIKPSMVSADNRIKALESVAGAKLNYVQTQYPDTHAAVMWLRDNHSMFRGRIYEPIIIEMNVRSDEYCKYIENCVKLQDLIAFTCEETEDMNKFLKIMRIDHKLKVNAVHSQAANALRYKPMVPINDVRKFGGEIYLIDCIEAPFPILNYLCQVNKLQNVLIGNENLELKADMLPPTLSLFFTPTHRVAKKMSKYSGAASMMSTVIRSKNWLNVRMSKTEMEELQQQRQKLVKERDDMYNKRNELEGRINMFEEQCKTNFQEKSEHSKRILAHELLEKKVKQQEKKLQDLQNEPCDIKAESERFRERVKEIVKKMHDLNQNSIRCYDDMMKIELNEVRAQARLGKFKNSTASFDAELMECNDEAERIKSYCDRIGNILDKTKQEAKEKQLVAMRMTENHKPSDGKKFPYKADFDALSGDRKVLREEMDDLEQQISCRSGNDQNVLDEYNDKVKTIATLKKELAKGSKSTESLEDDILAMHKKWFPKIQSIVKSINRNFSQFMGAMNCAGEVDLIFPTERDYEQYGIEIRVKYRQNEKLRALDRFVQSGGERAVAIAVYSLSLQHLSHVPFRCVDEINQGMDPNNERRVFEMLVKNVAKPGQSQFFYVTPKLQQDLPYNDYVTCITVLNGPFATHSVAFDHA